ncbi:MAG: endonuclease/exonuclease/phosphatase family protein [Rikenellaceae bacterium]
MDGIWSGRDSKQKKQSRFEIFSNLLLKVISVMAMLALLLTLIAPHITPKGGVILPTFALTAPIVYIVNIMLALCWLSLWRWQYAIAMSILLLFGMGRVSRFVKVSSTKSYEEEIHKGAIKMMTYNVRWFNGIGWDSKYKDIVEFFEQVSPDILTTQEFSYNKKLFEEYAPNMSKYNVVKDEGLSIITRYPIIANGNTLNKDNELQCRAIWVDIVVGVDTLRIFNNHLQSTDIKESDNRYLTSSKIIRDSNRNRVVKGVLKRYAESCVTRAKQVDEISKVIAESPYKVIVCGDFNDTPQSYAYNTLADGLRDAFSECGDGYSYTYLGFFNMLRIDYILTDRDITPLSYKVDHELKSSDHLPVISHLRIEKTNPQKR